MKRETPTLPETLPADPMPLFQEWFEEAKAAADQPNPNAFALCTCTTSGLPSSRMVLCKQIEPATPAIVFFTNYTSRKGDQLAANPNVAAVFHWDHFDRQVRIEGAVTRTSDAESDEYYATRRLISRLGAWASHQSRPLASHEALMEQVGEVMMRFSVPLDALEDEHAKVHIPRPPHWGGFRIRIARIELWQGGDGRLHDRAVWERTGAAWGPGTRLQP